MTICEPKCLGGYILRHRYRADEQKAMKRFELGGTVLDTTRAAASHGHQRATVLYDSAIY